MATASARFERKRKKNEKYFYQQASLRVMKKLFEVI